MAEGLQDPELSLEELYEQARQMQPELRAQGEDFLRHLQETYPNQFDGAYYEQAQLKAPERAQAKINGEYRGDVSQVTDLLRGRIVVETPEQIEIVRREIAAQAETMHLERIKDSFAKPTGTRYSSLNTSTRLPNGHVAEFRIDQIDMVEAGNSNHLAYEETQEIQRRAYVEHRDLTPEESTRIGELNDGLRADHTRAAHRGGLDVLVNESGRTRLDEIRTNRAQGFADAFSRLGKNGGVIVGFAFGGLAGAFTLAAGGEKAEALEVTYEAAVPYGETQIDVVRGDMDAANRSATIETVSTVSSVGCAVAGGAYGATAGSIVPLAGTAAGGIIGGLAGGIGCGLASGQLTAIIYDRSSDIADFFDRTDDELFERMPLEVPPSAPPELQHLIELKRLHERAVEAREELGRDRTSDPDILSERRGADQRIEHIENSYDQAYEFYDDAGGLSIVQAYMSLWETGGDLAGAAELARQMDRPESHPALDRENWTPMMGGR